MLSRGRALRELSANLMARSHWPHPACNQGRAKADAWIASMRKSVDGMGGTLVPEDQMAPAR